MSSSDLIEAAANLYAAKLIEQTLAANPDASASELRAELEWVRSVLLDLAARQQVAPR